MAWTEEQLAALERLIASGTSSAAYQDRRVQYRSQDELLRLRDAARRDLGHASGGEAFIRTEFSKGL